MGGKVINIADRKIGEGFAPFVVAEMSGNHNQSFERALRIVEAAAHAGCDAIKLQTYTADTMTIDSSQPVFRIEDPSSLWKGRQLYDLYREACTPWDWHEAIFKKCRELGLVGFSTPFDATAVDFLEKLHVPAYKIASFENNDLPLIRKVAATGKPVILSTGMATFEEIREAVETVRSVGNHQILLLKCTSSYPSPPSESNLRTIFDLRERLDVLVGLSDHTLGIGTAIASVALGASMIEKHFTLSRADGGVDSAFSAEPDEMKLLAEEARKAYESLGAVYYGPTPTEKASLQFRRSVFVIADIKAGERFTSQNIRVIRPGFGLAPKHYPDLIGRKAKTDLKKGTPLSWECVA